MPPVRLAEPQPNEKAAIPGGVPRRTQAPHRQMGATEPTSPDGIVRRRGKPFSLARCAEILGDFATAQGNATKC